MQFFSVNLWLSSRMARTFNLKKFDLNKGNSDRFDTKKRQTKKLLFKNTKKKTVLRWQNHCFLALFFVEFAILRFIKIKRELNFTNNYLYDVFSPLKPILRSNFSCFFRTNLLNEGYSALWGRKWIFFQKLFSGYEWLWYFLGTSE